MTPGMSRPLRIQAAGLTYHVTARGNGKMAIFVDEVDRSTFTELLSSVVEKRQLACHADC
jgi:putative transposase